MPPRKKEETFESQLAKLEELVTRMEEGGLTLEESIKCYQQGAELEKKLETILDKTRRELAQLTHLDGECEIPLEDAK